MVVVSPAYQVLFNSFTTTTFRSRVCFSHCVVCRFFITFTGATMSGKLSVFGFLQSNFVKWFLFSLQGCGPPLPCHGAIVLQLCSPYKLYGVLVFAGCGRERACLGPDPIRVVPICRFAPAGRCQLQFCIIGIPYFVKVVVARSQRLRVQFPSRRWARGTSPPEGRVDLFSRIRLGIDPERVFPRRGANKLRFWLSLQSRPFNRTQHSGTLMDRSCISLSFPVRLYGSVLIET